MRDLIFKKTLFEKLQYLKKKLYFPLVYSEACEGWRRCPQPRAPIGRLRPGQNDGPTAPSAGGAQEARPRQGLQLPQLTMGRPWPPAERIPRPAKHPLEATLKPPIFVQIPFRPSLHYIYNAMCFISTILWSSVKNSIGVC